MQEVDPQTVRLLLDSLERRGLDPAAVWADLPVTRASVLERRERYDWDEWVALMQRASDACGGLAATEQLFAKGAGLRVGHAFVRLANAFLSLDDLYRLFARWGFQRSLMMRAKFERGGGSRARFTLQIGSDRAGSLPTLHFVVGVLRHLPGLQDLPDARVSMEPGATPHRAVYALVLPRDRSLVAGARRVLSVVGGAAATLDELAQQADEIGEKNAQLQAKLAELERAAGELRERDEWLGLALETGHVAVWRLDVAARTMTWSPGVARMHGLPEGTPPSVDAWMSALHPDDRERVRTIARDALARGDPFDVEYRVPRGRETAWVRSRGRSVRDESGRAHHALGALVDVTEQKLFETRLRLADRLISAGTLAAGVAHEINNPLTYVLGNVELLRVQAKADPALQQRIGPQLADVTDGLLRIRDTVRDLRSLSRPEEERVRVLDLRQVCETALRIATPLVRHRARIETRWGDEPAKVRANESRLGQVVINLVVNASQAMPERPAGESVIAVRMRREDAWSVVEVQDNGLGIPADVLPRIFDPFFTTKPANVGTGLGLAICHGIVTSLGGRIDVESEIGRGTTFRVALPTAAGDVQARATPPQRPGVGGGKVLVIDDDPVVRRIMARMLDAAGYAVREAESAAGALEIVSGDAALDAIVCDLMMPDGSGEKVRAALDESHPELARRMVIVTGGPVTETARAFLDRADVVVLPKPFDAGALVDAVAKARAR